MSAPEAEWTAALAEGRFLLQRAAGTGTVYFPPRLAEPRTGARDLDWIEASGLGTVYSVTIVAPRPPAESYNVVLVDLDEGPRMMSHVEGIAPEAVRIGLRVTARIATDGDMPVVVFDPA